MPVRQSVKRPWMPERKAAPAQSGRSAESKAVYKPRRWREFSEQYRRTNPLCAECYRNDILTDVTPITPEERKANPKIKPRGVVDHIVPINKGGDQYDPNNLQSLCTSCHNKKSAKDK